MRLKNQTALITGGATGIGAATAKLYAQEGCRVVIADINTAEAKNTLEEITSNGGEAHFVRANVARQEDLRAAMDAVAQHTGQLDILVTCAGIYKTPMVRVDQFDEDIWDEIIGVNLKGTFLCAKYALPLMQEKGGVMLLIASTAGVTVASDSLAYGASKGGVRGMAFSLKQQLAPLKIRVHVVCPNDLATPLKLQAIAEIAKLQGQSPDAAIAAALPNLAAPEEVARVLVDLGSAEGENADELVFTK
jgi:NAD(P)-dependent dehydrogenase (short-subunit alcohol dehydrogenase family)